MSKYAEGTSVSVARSKAELEELLAKYGATSLATYQSGAEAAVAFEMTGRRVVFKLSLPDPNDDAFTHKRVNQHGKGEPRPPGEARGQHEKACRRLWRSLLLAVKAKLVAVEDGVETFEQAFMAHVMMPDGRTVAEHVAPRIQHAYETGEVPKLLPPGAK